MPKPGKRDWAKEIPVMRIGLLGGENDADRLARVDGYKKLMETTFEVPVKLLVAADYAGVIQAFAAKQLETAYMSPGRLCLRLAGEQRRRRAAGGDAGAGRQQLLCRGDVCARRQRHHLARRDEGAFAGLGGPEQRLGLPDPARRVPRAGHRSGVGKYFGRTGFAGGHEQAVVAVLNHQYDGGVTWTSGVGDPAVGYTRGALRMMVDKKMLDMKDLRIIWKSRPILNGPLTVRKSTPASYQADMLAFHLALPTAYPDIYHTFDMGSGKGWVPVKHEDFQVFIDMLQQEAAARRRR